MSTRPDPAPPRPLIDPVTLEAAGRSFREWLERLLSRRAIDTSIDWETGEPDDERTPPAH